MALITAPGVRMILSLLAAAAAVLAGLLLLGNLLMSGAYAGRVPMGADAMGLVVPLFCAIAAALLLLAATGLLLANGGLDWLGARGGWRTMLVMLGVGFAAAAVLVAWMERMGAWVMPLGLFFGVLAPLSAVALLLASAWRDGAVMQAATWPKMVAGLLVLAALGGAVLLAWGLVLQARHGAAVVEQARVEQVRRNIESARRDALSPIERLREDYAEFSPNTPLWVFIAGLPDPTEPEVRDFIIARALQVPNLDGDLEATIADQHPRYRHGASEFVRYVPDAALKPRWIDAVAASMRVSATQIAANPDWLQPDAFANPDPVAHLASLVAAALRFAPDAKAQAAQAELRAAIARLPAGAQRDRALAAVPAP